jgi:DNA-binding transcriptional LysR family regulator
MDRLETRDLVYFVAVAEELHFTKAAERLGMAQPPLSRAVAQLERRMGVRLLERTSRRVELTPAGVVFLDDCRRLLRDADAAVHRAQRASRAARPVLAVRPGTGTGVLSEIVRSYGTEGPELLFTYDQVDALQGGRADVALLCVGTDDLTGLLTAEVAEELPVVLLPHHHRLADRAGVTVGELRREPAYQEQCPPVGLDEILDRVALGRLVAVVGSATAERLAREVVAVPVTDLPATTLAFGWPRNAPMPDIVRLARTLRRGATGRTHPADRAA